nr:NAD(P)H-dependent oxidoreductase [uncultured Carboxylicivirga sp.]
MKITILNGDMQGCQSSFSDYINELSNKLCIEHTVNTFHLQQMNLRYCTGCWSCWWKTPGMCVIKDDAEDIFRSVINADFVIFTSPLMLGFTSSSLKKITDRLIVLLHPYVKLKNGECHHLKRYNKYPDFGLIIQPEQDTDEEDLSILKDIYDRFALNFHCERKYLKIANPDNFESIINETCHI